MPNPNDPFSGQIDSYAMQNRALMAQIAAQLQGNMQMMGSSVPLANTTYMGAQPFTSPTMFGQFSNAIGSIFGEEAGAITQTAGQLMASPGLRGMFGPLGGMVSTMMSSMPIGGGADPGAFMYSQLQSRMGRTIPRAVSLPADFSSQAAIDLYNEEQAQFNQFAGITNGAPGLRRFEQTGEGYSLGVQLANVKAMSSEGSRFKDVFNMFSAATGQNLQDKDLQPLIALAEKNTPEAAAEAEALLKANPELKRKATKILDTANNAANLGNLAMNISSMIPPGILGGAETGALQGLGDIFMGLTGMDRNPQLFTAAAVQSLSMMGALGTATFDEGGKRVFAGERIVAGLTGNLERESGPYSGMRSLGASKAGQLMNELTKSGLLTSGGVDTFGAVKAEDVKKIEDAIAKQLEGFSAVAAAGKRLGLQINEIVQSMQTIYGGRFGEELSNAAGREFSKLREGISGPIDEGTRAFLEAEAQRKAGASMMQQVEKAVQIGRFAGFDARGSMAVLQTASQMAQDMGMTGEAGLSMGASALSRVALSRRMGMPMTMDQALAMSQDVMAKGANNPSVQAFASLKLAINAGVIKEQDAQSFLNDFNSGKDIDPGAVNKLIAQSGANLAAFTGREAVARGMSMAAPEINQFYATNENVSVTGTVKRAFKEAGINAEALVQQMASGSTDDLAKAFNMTSAEVKSLDFTQFVAKFNQLNNQQQRIDLLDSMTKSKTITPEQRAQLLSNLGERMDRFGLASDKGSTRTARIRQAEEAERAMHGGMTSVEISAGAVAENQRMLNEAFGPKGSIQKDLTEGLSQVREDKIQKKMKAGATREEAEASVDAEGFSFTELLQSASRATDPGMRAAVDQSLKDIDSQLTAAQKSGNKGRVEQLTRQKQEMLSFQDMLSTTDPAERAKKLEKLRGDVEKDLHDKDVATRRNMSESQKKAEEVQQATVATAKDVKELVTLTRAMAQHAGISAEALQSLEGKVA